MQVTSLGPLTEAVPGSRERAIYEGYQVVVSKGPLLAIFQVLLCTDDI